jgi:hypothetical protein
MGLNPQDRWLEFVQNLRASDALFAAKIESLLFLGEKNKVLDLAIPQKMNFLKDQMSDLAVQKKLQSFIEKIFGVGYRFEIQTAKDESAGTSAQAMVQTKQKSKEEDMAKQVADHPRIKSATAAFKGQIKSIKGPQ